MCVNNAARLQALFTLLVLRGRYYVHIVCQHSTGQTLSLATKSPIKFEKSLHWYHIYYRAEKTTIVRPRQKDARGENTKINYGLDTGGEKEKGASKKKKSGWKEYKQP